MTNGNEINPPRPRLAVCIGVTGHRLEGLTDINENMLIHQVESVLSTAESVVNRIHADEVTIYNDEPPIIRVLSPLAEGADRIVARVALNKNFDLQCPLPFFREVYENDFEESESVKEYHDLLDRASAVMELDGSNGSIEQRGEAYESVGRMVSKQSDLMIAIWDGEKSSGRGGTGQIVGESLERGIPVVWIDAKAPHDIKLLWSKVRGSDKSPMAILADYLEEILCIEATYDVGLWQAHFLEKSSHWILLGAFYTGFSNFLERGKPGKPNIRVRRPVQIKKREWDRDWNHVPDFPQNIKEDIEGKILPHEAWADFLARYYGDKYRGSFLMNYILAGFAVFFALLAFALGWTDISHPNYHQQWIWSITEIVIVFTILINIYRGTSGRWHLQWLTYRLLAERLRQMRFLIPLGMVLPLIRLPAHKEAGKEQFRYSWGNRLFSAINREVGLPTARMEPDYLRACLDFVKEVEIKGQIHYHVENAARYQRLSRHLHVIGYGLFWLTLFAAIMHLIYYGPYAQWFVFITAVAPAFGAAAYGISSHGEFGRIANQSRAMSMHLETVLEDINNMGQILSTVNLQKLLESVSKIMLSELIDWDFLYREKDLTLPV